jgi:hypothetical protein
MAAALFPMVAQVTSTAQFRAWGLAMSTAIQAAGMHLRAETGTVDWAAATLPAQNSLVNFEVYEFTDALQATAPFVVRFDYGWCSSSLQTLWITVGTDTNGSGTVTGVLINQMRVTSWNSSPSVLWSVASGDGSYLVLGLLLGFLDISTYFAIERTHAADGSDTNLGCTVLRRGNSTDGTAQVYCSRTAQISAEVSLGALVPSVGHGSIGSQTMVFPIFPAAGPFLNPLKSVLLIHGGNVTTWVPFSVGHYGATHVYLPLPAYPLVEVRGAVSGYVLAVRWE